MLRRMTRTTDGGSESGPGAVARIEKRFYGDLGGVGDGAAKGGPTRKYFRDDHPPRFPAPGGVEVVTVGDDAEQPFAETVALGLGLPASSAPVFARLPERDGWHCYLAQVDGNPAAAAAMLVDGEVAQLGLAATLEPGHGTRAGLALLRRAIEDGVALGVRRFVADVETGDEDGPRAVRRDLRDAGFTLF
jgi:Acetyltransferase (GNAT) domain